MRNGRLIACSITAVAAIGVSSEAYAGDYTCGSVGNGYAGACYSGVSETGVVTATMTSTNAIASFGFDSGSGQGVVGASDTGIGVIGFTNDPQNVLHYPGGKYGVYGTVTTSSPTDSGTYGVFGYGNSTNDAVHGLVMGAGNGVYGVATGGNGVYGKDTGSGYGVQGVSSSGSGVYGNTGNSSGSGVAGVNTSSGHGVYGKATGGYGVYGYDTGSGYGIYGTSASGTAIYATASGSGGYGIIGKQSGSGGIGVFGENTDGGAGVQGQCTGTGCYAGSFLGNVFVSGTVTQNSDSRLKKNIKPISGAIDQLVRLNGVSFEWIEPGKHGDQTGTQRGFVAQDVEKVFPEWVRTDRDGFKTLSVQQIEALEVEAIRELKTKNDALEERLKALETARRPVVLMNANGLGMGMAGLAIAGAVVFTRRKRGEG